MLMNKKDLHNLLMAETWAEKEQKRTGENIFDLELIEQIDPEMIKVFAQAKTYDMPEEIFFKRGNVFISKHNRYAPMPDHKHAFLEINYMYQGSCRQEIDGESLVLQKGDFIMLDRESHHAIDALGEGDILINLLLRFDWISTAILQKMTDSVSILSKFLAQAGQANQKYLVFKGNERLDDLMQLILTEYYNDQQLSLYVLEMYLPLLFTELSRSQHQLLQEQPQEDEISKSLQLIEKYYRTITLSWLANEVGYNSNYLSNMIKKRTGLNFKTLVQTQRMQHAYQLVRHTNYTIEEICEQIGLQDPSYFYQSFKKLYGTTPAKIRKQH